MIKSALILAAGLCALVAPAHAQQWRLAAQQTDRHPMQRMFIDAGNMRTDGSIITTRVMTVLEPRDGYDWTTSIIDREIDCSRTATRVLAARFYSIGGTLLEEIHDTGDWKTPNSGSVLEGVILTTCGRRDYQSLAIANPQADAQNYFKTH